MSTTNPLRRVFVQVMCTGVGKPVGVMLDVADVNKSVPMSPALRTYCTALNELVRLLGPIGEMASGYDAQLDVVQAAQRELSGAELAFLVEGAYPAAARQVVTDYGSHYMVGCGDNDVVPIAAIWAPWAVREARKAKEERDAMLPLALIQQDWDGKLRWRAISDADQARGAVARQIVWLRQPSQYEEAVLWECFSFLHTAERPKRAWLLDDLVALGAPPSKVDMPALMAALSACDADGNVGY